MKPVDPIQENAWRRQRFLDPVPVLRKLREIELAVIAKQLPAKVRHLRTPELKRSREIREAAIFTHGLAEVTGTKVHFAAIEDGDFDFVTRWSDDTGLHYCPAQLKEWVPPELNPRAELDALLQAAARLYEAKSDTALVVHVNRRTRLDLSAINVPDLPFNGVWLFGATSLDQSRWTLWGDLRSDPRAFEFAYPLP